MLFSHYQENSIEFWECSSHCNWHPHKTVNTETKLFNPTPMLLSKLSWDFSKKTECNDLITKWKMMLQLSDMRGRQFLNLVNSDNYPLEPSYIKGGPWLQHFGHSNSLYARASRAITNHTPTGEYRLRFFPREEFRCSCGHYPIESRCHILHECKRFNEYWNPRRDLVAHFVMFLELNPNVFAFPNAIT